MSRINNVYFIFVIFSGITSLHASTIYTDRIAWETAVSTFNTEQFNDTFVNSHSITFSSGITSSTIGGLSANFVNSAYEFNGAVNNRTGNPDTELEWIFPESIFAFGADFTSIDSDGLKVSGNFDGLGLETFSLASYLTGGSTPCVNCFSGFFGVLGDSQFNNLIWQTDNSEETFQIDNFSIATAVPLPPTSYLFIVGIVGLLVARCNKASANKSMHTEKAKLRSFLPTLRFPGDAGRYAFK